MNRLVATLLVAAAVGAPAPALAWADKGHRIITTLAQEAFPAELPAFLRTSKARWTLGELAREPDRSRGAGQPHGADLDPSHFVDVDDAGKVMGGPPLANLPPNRSEYEKALVAAGSDTREAGWLPYNVMTGWQQLAKDFAYWRTARVGERSARSRADRARFRADRELREMLILRDLGYWSHFVGDGSNPMHVSVHYNGWGKYPNPRGYTTEPIHGPFEDAFVYENVRRDAVKSAMGTYQPCNCTIQQATTRYLQESLTLVEPLYALWKEGGFAKGDPRGTAFATGRLAAGATQLRTLVVDAWRASEDVGVGFPAVTVKAIEAGQPIPPDAFFGRE